MARYRCRHKCTRLCFLRISAFPFHSEYATFPGTNHDGRPICSGYDGDRTLSNWTRGIYASSLARICPNARVQYELEQQLCLFARDEVMTWYHQQRKPWTFDISFRSNVAANIDGVVKRAETMACKAEREQVFDGRNLKIDRVLTHSSSVSGVECSSKS